MMELRRRHSHDTDVSRDKYDYYDQDTNLVFSLDVYEDFFSIWCSTEVDFDRFCSIASGLKAKATTRGWKCQDIGKMFDGVDIITNSVNLISFKFRDLKFPFDAKEIKDLVCDGIEHVRISTDWFDIFYRASPEKVAGIMSHVNASGELSQVVSTLSKYSIPSEYIQGQLDELLSEFVVL